MVLPRKQGCQMVYFHTKNSNVGILTYYNFSWTFECFVVFCILYSVLVCCANKNLATLLEKWLRKTNFPSLLILSIMGTFLLFLDTDWRSWNWMLMYLMHVYKCMYVHMYTNLLRPSFAVTSVFLSIKSWTQQTLLITPTNETQLTWRKYLCT
jgi:hypothetical protein